MIDRENFTGSPTLTIMSDPSEPWISNQAQQACEVHAHAIYHLPFTISFLLIIVVLVIGEPASIGWTVITIAMAVGLFNYVESWDNTTPNPMQKNNTGDKFGTNCILLQNNQILRLCWTHLSSIRHHVAGLGGSPAFHSTGRCQPCGACPMESG